MRKPRKLNKPFLRRLARKLRRLRHEEHYDQGELAVKTQCGTAACVAGHAVIEAGLKLVPYYKDAHRALFVECVAPSGKTRNIAVVATELLGLTPKWASRLFTGVPTAHRDWSGDERDWPAEFVTRWEAGKERKSRIAADLLDAIADTNGKILA